MEYILVMFQMEQGQEVELKVSASITAGEFLEAVGKAFNINNVQGKCLHVEPLGRILGVEEVFAAEGVYNGSKMTLV